MTTCTSWGRRRRQARRGRRERRRRESRSSWDEPYRREDWRAETSTQDEAGGGRDRRNAAREQRRLGRVERRGDAQAAGEAGVAAQDVRGVEPPQRALPVGPILR